MLARLSILLVFRKTVFQDRPERVLTPFERPMKSREVATRRRVVDHVVPDKHRRIAVAPLIVVVVLAMNAIIAIGVK